jgi:group I intron endonuclease
MDLCGIYALYWPISSMVYTGQSQTINKRYREHLSCLNRNAHANPKVQHQYSLHGKPELVVLEVCNIDQLYNNEILWTTEFNALVDGLNIIEPGPSGWGVNSNQSKYSKFQVLKVFSLLTTTDLANIDIANKIGVSLRLVECIRGGYSHTWLKEAYPQRYSKLENKSKVKNTIARRLGTIPVLVNTSTGQIVEINSVVDFAKDICNNTSSAFASGIRRVIRKEQKEFQNWKLQQLT